MSKNQLIKTWHEQYHGLATEVHLKDGGKLWYCKECLREQYKKTRKLEVQIQVKLNEIV